MARRNEVVAAGSASWTLDEDAARSIEIAVPSLCSDEGERYLLSVKNGSAVVGLSVSVANLVAFDGSAEAAEVAAFDVEAGGRVGKVVTGFPLGAGGRLTFTKSAVTAPAFSVCVELRRA